jgi:hypothetical protein
VVLQEGGVPTDDPNMTGMNETTPQDGPSDDSKGCSGCGRVFLPWITTCPGCGSAIDHGFAPDLTSQPAPVVTKPDRWIDIPVSADEPVQVALLKHFLGENDFAFEESRRFISVFAEDAPRLSSCIEIWAFHPEPLNDDRHLDSLAGTLRELGHRVLNSVHSCAPAGRSLPAVLLDLR